MKAIILAAGEGKRMHSARPKVLHRVCGRQMLGYVIDAVKAAGATEVIVVVGHKADEVRAEIGDGVKYVEQAKQLGTGHAVGCAGEYITPDAEVLVICGDTPLVTAEGIARLKERHTSEGNGATVLSTVMDNPTGYGRVVYENGMFSRIVEHKDADEKTRTIKEINAAIYIFNGARLAHAIKNLKNNNAAGEYYLPDTLEIIKNLGYKIGVYKNEDAAEFSGVNTHEQLADVSRIMRRRINGAHMNGGVSMTDPENTYIDYGVTIGAGTQIYPGTIMEGQTEVGENCVIGPNTRLVNTKVESCTNIAYSVVLESVIGESAQVGPFAYIRPGCKIGSRSRIGDFVEVKNSQIGDNTKVSHLTYIGDSDVGSGINFGCGTVTVNYDGNKKYRTVIRDNAFIGCNTNLIAPVTVDNGAYIAAGSTITEDVPGGSLAVARARQVNLPGRAGKHLKEH